MSAWVPEKEHVDLLVDAADLLRDRIPVAFPQDKDELGQMLLDEVVASVSYRYPNDDVEKGELPGPLDAYYTERYEHTAHGVVLNAAEMRHLIACYDYQACEHPGWEASTAHDVCEGIRAALGTGESDGPWGWDSRDVERRKTPAAPANPEEVST